MSRRNSVDVEPDVAVWAWKNCVVDAPDAYFSNVSVRIADGEVILFHNKNGTEQARYRLDRPVSWEESPNDRTFGDSVVTGVVGVVDMAPLIVRPDSSCACSSTRRVAK